MENRWADPEGVAVRPLPIRYQILGASGAIVERQTSVNLDVGRNRYYHALAPDDQRFADSIVDLIQRACAYFYAPEGDYEPLDGVPEARLTDAEVSERIQRLDGGENTREAERMNQARYPLTDLPFDQQRALVERIEVLKQEWQFAFLGEVQPEESPVTAQIG